MSRDVPSAERGEMARVCKRHQTSAPLCSLHLLPFSKGSSARNEGLLTRLFQAVAVQGAGAALLALGFRGEQGWAAPHLSWGVHPPTPAPAIQVVAEPITGPTSNSKAISSYGRSFSQ